MRTRITEPTARWCTKRTRRIIVCDKCTVSETNDFHFYCTEIHYTAVGVRHLTLNNTTLAHNIYLNLVTAGYYPGTTIAQFRYWKRGGFRCWEDTLFAYKNANPNIVQQLKEVGFPLSFNCKYKRSSGTHLRSTAQCQIGSIAVRMQSHALLSTLS